MVGFEELVEAMKGEDTLSGWDVLVSYNEAQLNALLAERARTLNFTVPNTWETPYKEFVSGNTYTLVFDVTLSQPTMKFADTTNSITLIMGLAGQYVVKETGMTTALPAGLTCEVSTSLVNVAGEWHEEGWTPAPPIEGEQEPKKDNWVVIIEPGDSNARGICVDLKYCVVELGEASGANIPEGTMALLDPQIKPFIRKHFAKYGYRLCLAAVSNHFDVSEADSELLRPEKFCFTVQSGALLMWIGLKGGPNTGTTPTSQTSISFAPSSIARSPIPMGNNASIIFSHTTMASLFLGPALKQSPDITDVKCTSTRTYHGMRFTINFTSHAVTIPALDWQGIPGNDYHVDGCNINLNENACTLTIYADTRPGTIGHDPFSLSWSSSTKTIKSKSHQSGSMQGQRPPSQYSSCSATFSYAGTGQWKGSSDPIKHPNQLGVEWALDQSLSIKIQPEKPNWWEIYNGKVGDVPSNYKDIRPKAPSLNLSLKPLDYFLTTNLLFPGQKIFIADEVEYSLSTPRDTLLTGNIAVNAVASTRRADKMRRHRKFLGMTAGSQPVSLPATESTDATVDDLKVALFAFPSNNMLGDLLKDTLGDSGNLSAVDLLQKHGFGHLTDENFLSLWGTSIEELLGTIPEAPAAAGPTQIDMRLYSGYYIISQPEDDSGEQFLIHPLTGAIRMRNNDIVPQQIFNTEARRVMVTWQSPATGATYSASFSLCVDQDTLALGTKCEGTITRSGDELGPQPFAAFRKGFPPPPTLLKGSDARVLHLLGEEEDPADKASLVKTAVSNSLRQEYAKHVTAQGLALEDLEKRVDAAAKAKLDEILKTDENALNGPNQQDVLDKLRQAAKEALAQEAPSALNSLTRDVIQAALARNSFSTALPNGRPEVILGELQAQEAKRAIDLLEGTPVPGSKAFSELSARKVADQERTNAASLDVVKLLKARIDLENSLKSKDEAAKKFEKEVVEEAKKKAEDPGATEAAKQAYKDAQKDLDKMKAEREAEDKKHENAKENEKKGDDYRIECESREQESREMERKKREHILGI
ncbi:hypothetical protein FMEXI_6473 [Fusarium mexicanum]|uniref:Uncharacterized protein n=1 Tax=Fusarium mexicanum TaxID=751941 RepID=A0A8H5MXD5_9HYPO|nr:hypothetical protein FMEXI_6473 [Fusarium mexicanum]